MALRLKCAQSVSTSTNTPSEISSPEFRRVGSRRSRSAFVVLPNTVHLDLASLGARAMLSTFFSSLLLLPLLAGALSGLTATAERNDVDASKKPRRIAVIGAGKGGSSTAHWLTNVTWLEKYAS